MRKLLLFTALLIYASFSFGQNCLPNGITLFSQEEVDNFASDYPGCTTILGSLTIDVNGTITNLNGLSQITSIEGHLEIYNGFSLTNLTGLDNLNSISGHILFQGLSINDFSGLDNLSSIGGKLQIEFSQFDNFNGFSGLPSIGNEFRITSSTFNNFEGLEGLTTIGADFSIALCSFENFIGLNSLTGIQGSFHLSDNQFINLDGLSNLNSIGNNLQLNKFNLDNFIGLEGLTTIGAGLSVKSSSFENFIGLNNLTEIQGNFHLSNNQFTSFNGLEGVTAINGSVEITSSTINNFIGFNNLNTVNGRFYITHSEVNSFHGLENLHSINDWFVLNHVDLLKDFSGLENINTFSNGFSTYDCNDLVNFTGLENLTLIEGFLEVFNCPNLISLTGLEQVEITDGSSLYFYNNDALLSIKALESLNPNSIKYLDISGNPSLSICESNAICAYLGTSQGQEDASVSSNAPGCNDEMEILIECYQGLSKIRYYTFYDFNQNQVFDSDEILYSDASIEVDPLAYYSYDNSDNGGTIHLEPGDYTLKLITNPLWDITTDSSAFQLSLNDPNSCDTLYFGLFPNQVKSMLISTIQSPPARCNEWVTFDVTTKNLGTTTTNGILWFAVDENIVDVAFINPPDTIVEPYLYGWNFSGLYPGQSVTKEIKLKIPGPLDFQLGNDLHFKSYVEFNSATGLETSAEFLYDTEVRCSFDPNDKLVHPKREGNYTLFEEQLIYTVRFQNTGNDFAYDVTIRDTLDANLNPETFRVLGTSHPNQLATTLQDGQFLTFSFENIFLPDSTTDFDGSQGYVSYLIEGNENLPEETNISNTASIYFDSNPPVVTNTTENLMVSELPTTAIDPEAESLQFSIFPNPTNDKVQTVNPHVSEATIQVRDYTGRLLEEIPFHFQQTISLVNYPAGVYWIQLKTKNNSLSQKIIKF